MQQHILSSQPRTGTRSAFYGKSIVHVSPRQTTSFNARKSVTTRAAFGIKLPGFDKKQELSAPPTISYKDPDIPVTQVHSPQEFQDLMKANPGKLTILMAKAAGCRPCRAFAKHYYAAAKHYSDSVFVEILGDESLDNRGMMKELKIKVTPTFVLFRNGESVHQHGGINQKNFHTAIQEQLGAEEAGFGKWEHLIVEEEKKEDGGH